MEGRARVFRELASRIGSTPLVEYRGEVPNGNSIWIKREFDNPYGSHYDRVYLELFRHYEEIGAIQPGRKVLETTSGSAGASFAGIGRELGYECFVVIPEGGERAREEAILRCLRDEEHLIRTPAQDYVNGFPRFLRSYLPRNRDVFFLNHSMGDGLEGRTGLYGNNEITLGALEEIAYEVLAEIGSVGFFFPAVGNGSSVLGPGRVFQRMNEVAEGVIGNLMDEPSSFGIFNLSHYQDTVDSRTRIIPWETVQSATMYDLKFPGKYESHFGISPGSLTRHDLPGTSFQGINFPHIRNALDLAEDIVLVSGDRIDMEYEALTGRTDTRELVHYPSRCDGEFGKTTLAGISVALEAAERVGDRSMLLIGYDRSDRYDCPSS